ncbi:FAD-binding oxidoreductase [Kangiella sp. TOML190]|uniref:NAD(P)/FAD-dependent oxidoreductase n=1 Tax=Kangiella sp. TOML190 TaxID=2931351 RepID=UPI00203AA97E|nr:FAD-binding oxidoreductase [Kangiella sp. TOML190]
MPSSYPNSYYAATSRYQITNSPLPQKLEVETCIIGAGYAGLMTALGLIERGHESVAIVEKNKVGFGCSGRNGGFVFGGYSLGPKALINQVGEDKARDLYQLTKSAVDLIRHRVAQYEIDCDLVGKGVIWANWFNDQQFLLQEKAFMQDKMGLDWTYLSPEQLKEQIKSERYHGGLFEPNAMHFHPLNYALGVAQAITQQGGQIFEDCEVLDIDYQSAEKTVKTAQGNISAKNVVLSGGGYLGDLCKPVARSILPIATYVMATEPLGDRLKDFINTEAAIYDTRFAFDYYRALTDTRILWGGHIHANTNKPKNLDYLLKKDLAKVFPELQNLKVEYDWQGWMAYARHQMAQIGQVAPGVWYGIGFGGHGVAPTTAAGEVLAEAISDQGDSYKQFEPWGLPWNGGPFGPAAAQLSYWWYQLKDYLKEKLQ